MQAKTPRPYDATRRRERAEAERQATRRRVVEAAGRLFVANGYVGTTIADIAEQAGVAIPSVYKAAESKAHLVMLAMEVAVRGDDVNVPLVERPDVTAIGAETDPKRQVEMIATLVASIQERSAPLQVALRQAAVEDETAAASLVESHRLRVEAFTDILGWIPAKHLRGSLEEAVDAVWVLASPEVFNLLRTMRGWDVDRYRKWLSGILIDVLLG